MIFDYSFKTEEISQRQKNEYFAGSTEPIVFSPIDSSIVLSPDFSTNSYYVVVFSTLDNKTLLNEYTSVLVTSDVLQYNSSNKQIYFTPLSSQTKNWGDVASNIVVQLIVLNGNIRQVLSNVELRVLNTWTGPL